MALNRFSDALIFFVAMFGAIILMGSIAVAQDIGAGKITFAKNCSACHQVTGLGIKGAFPALAGDALVQGADEVLIKTVLQGRGGMPTFAAMLKDQDLANVLSYVRSAWGNHSDPIDPERVAAIRETLAAVDTRPKGN
jgi:mono/diheme cytochrome c family protein